MTSILVLGGSQFVSKALAKYLIKENYKVDILTRSQHPIDYAGFRTHLIADRRDKDQLEQVLKGRSYDYVFDISAYTKKDIEILIDVLPKSDLKRYVFCSSGSVYHHSENWIDEEGSRGANPNWGVYGLDKKVAEDYVFSYAEKELPITIFRPSYIYGEGNNLYREAYLFDRIEQGKPIPVPIGDCQVQFIYITDAVKMMASVINHTFSVGKAYNVTYKTPVNWKTWIETAELVVGKKAKVVHVDETLLPDKIKTRHYFPFRHVSYLLSNEKALAHGLYEPSIDLLEGLSLAYVDFKNNPMDRLDKTMNKVDEVANGNTNLIDYI
ncbi:NAD-dependent epimerase/dehydratase family protein [Terrilactibacillus laevilacticus]|uniref:NAD-dependent epimerase/dehydratase family protein n=1 Tax=Terrilactibacillus laevilacticus TaxID=1380157 RepID=UPI0011471D18|nr:NAD-dependent epimerase/dehydratase family protein [Terrilactibacillus laevilacticus]